MIHEKESTRWTMQWRDLSWGYNIEIFIKMFYSLGIRFANPWIEYRQRKNCHTISGYAPGMISRFE